MNTRETVAEWLRDELIDSYTIPPSEITDEAEFKDDLGLDSLDIMELQLLIQERYGIVISDQEMLLADTFGAAVDMIIARATA